MSAKQAWRIGILTMVLGAASALCAQQPQKPLTNADVIKMVRGRVSESIVVSTIQSLPSQFDTSPDALIALHKAGVTQTELNAIIAASNLTTAGGASLSGKTSPNEPGLSPTKTKSRMPVVSILQNGAEQRLPLEKTQLAQTKNKPTSMGKMAADTAMVQGMQATMNTATAQVASHMGAAGGTLGQVGGTFSSILGQRKPEITYVWGLASPASTTVLSEDTPQVSLNFATVPGINPDEFEPAMVKLTPAQNTCRLVGATRGKEDALSTSAVDWQIYSGFVEDRVKIQSQKLGAGHYQISPSSPLLPGEYGVVLRPISKDKKISGGDVARAQGDGLMFDAVWSFQISGDAQ